VVLKRFEAMLGLRFSRMVHAAIAGGSLAPAGCVERLLLDPALLDSSSDTDSSTGDPGTATADTEDPTFGPTSPTNPTNPTNPTSITDPSTVTDPTTPTTGPVEGPPQLLDVRLIDPLTLELYFSEAMANPTSVDPGLFRLSLAYSNYYAEYYEWGGTFYQDLKQFTGEQQCYEYCWCKYYKYDYCYDYYCGESCYQQPGPPINPIVLTTSTNGSDRLLLALDSPITPEVCNAVDQYQQQWTGSGLFLHYSNNGAPVVDTQGEQLLPIAEHWVLPPHKDYGYEQGYFPAMTPFIPIACPF
jgi:hypothetical protein